MLYDHTTDTHDIEMLSFAWTVNQDLSGNHVVVVVDGALPSVVQINVDSSRGVSTRKDGYEIIRLPLSVDITYTKNFVHIFKDLPPEMVLVMVFGGACIHHSSKFVYNSSEFSTSKSINAQGEKFYKSRFDYSNKIYSTSLSKIQPTTSRYQNLSESILIDCVLINDRPRTTTSYYGGVIVSDTYMYKCSIHGMLVFMLNYRSTFEQCDFVWSALVCTADRDTMKSKLKSCRFGASNEIKIKSPLDVIDCTSTEIASVSNESINYSESFTIYNDDPKLLVFDGDTMPMIAPPTSFDNSTLAFTVNDKLNPTLDIRSMVSNRASEFLKIILRTNGRKSPTKLILSGATKSEHNDLEYDLKYYTPTNDTGNLLLDGVDIVEVPPISNFTEQYADKIADIIIGDAMVDYRKPGVSLFKAYAPFFRTISNSTVVMSLFEDLCTDIEFDGKTRPNELVLLGMMIKLLTMGKR